MKDRKEKRGGNCLQGSASPSLGALPVIIWGIEKLTRGTFYGVVEGSSSHLILIVSAFIIS